VYRGRTILADIDRRASCSACKLTATLAVLIAALALPSAASARQQLVLGTPHVPSISSGTFDWNGSAGAIAFFNTAGEPGEEVCPTVPKFKWKFALKDESGIYTGQVVAMDSIACDTMAGPILIEPSIALAHVTLKLPGMFDPREAPFKHFVLFGHSNVAQPEGRNCDYAPQKLSGTSPVGEPMSPVPFSPATPRWLLKLVKPGSSPGCRKKGEFRALSFSVELAEGGEPVLVSRR
jgi:hypothetical protein